VRTQSVSKNAGDLGSSSNHENRAFAFAVGIRCGGAGHALRERSRRMPSISSKVWGSEIVTVVPLPGVLWISTRPARRSMSCFVMYKPRPVALVGPARGAVRLAKLLEHMAEPVGRDADTGVLHADGETRRTGDVTG